MSRNWGWERRCWRCAWSCLPAAVMAIHRRCLVNLSAAAQSQGNQDGNGGNDNGNENGNENENDNSNGNESSKKTPTSTSRSTSIR